jgi:putative transposase
MKRSRQSYYKCVKRRARGMRDEEQLLQMVHPIRHQMPRLGGRKLYYMIQETMNRGAIKMGRDRFFQWLGTHDLLIRPKRRYVSTTQSHHRFYVYKNLTERMQVSRPDQLWVSDITYIKSLEGFCYLALITDAYSRKIVGYDVSDSLELNGCMRALRSALQTASDLGQLIHHSDRGIQYCSNQYTNLLLDRGIRISMADKGNCYQNAMAERVNGILKNEFNLDYTFRSKKQAIETVHQSIYIYNQHRPHWALELKTPNYCHALN